MTEDKKYHFNDPLVARIGVDASGNVFFTVQQQDENYRVNKIVFRLGEIKIESCNHPQLQHGTIYIRGRKKEYDSIVDTSFGKPAAGRIEEFIEAIKAFNNEKKQQQEA